MSGHGTFMGAFNEMFTENARLKAENERLTRDNNSLSTALTGKSKQNERYVKLLNLALAYVVNPQAIDEDGFEDQLRAALAGEGE